MESTWKYVALRPYADPDRLAKSNMTDLGNVVRQYYLFFSINF
jgi:hypothetical protein